MPSPGDGILVYGNDGTPYHIPTDSLAEFEVKDTERAKLEENAVSGSLESGTVAVKAYHVRSVGPPAWPVGAAR
jgi:hypothetical protein